MLLSIRVLAVASLAIWAVVLIHPRVVSAVDAVREQPAALASAEPTPIELALFQLSNADRARAGLPPLRFDTDALELARARAAAQPTESALTHYDAAGNMVFAELLVDFGLKYDLAGENLARVSGPASAAAQQAETGLMNSPTHRANILEPTFELLAVGSTVDERGRVVFAQVFRSVE